MAKNINHIQHLKSSVVENSKPKLPASNLLVEGEIAVNYAEGYETLSIKSSSGTIKTFSSDEYYTKLKLGSGFTGVNSARTVTDVIEEDEQTISAALVDLDERKADKSELEENYYTKEEIDEADFVTANAINDLNDRKLDSSAYTPADMTLYYTKLEIDNGFYTKEEIDDAEYTTATALNELREDVEDKADEIHMHKASDVTAMTSYAVALSASSISPSDTLNEAIGKLEKRVELIEDDMEYLDLALETISTALNDLNSRIDEIDSQSEVIAAAFNDLNDRLIVVE